VREARVSFLRNWSVWILLACNAVFLQPAAGIPRQANSPEELLTLPGEIGRAGGRLVISLRAEPKTLNPLTAADAPSREVIGAMQADLVHINRATQLTEPALAQSWKVSPDGLQYTVTLRKGLRFSDGQPLDADDVLFTFRLFLDEAVHATQRDLLIVAGKPITVRKVDTWTVIFQFAKTSSMDSPFCPGICWRSPTRKENLGSSGRSPR